MVAAEDGLEEVLARVFGELLEPYVVNDQQVGLEVAGEGVSAPVRASSSRKSRTRSKTEG